MPFSCSVPNCRGNYRGGPKVSAFIFPKNDELRKKWLTAIKRDNFTPTSSSRVCELHFRNEEVERSTKFYVTTGEALDVPLKVPRLKKGAIPSKLPGCPEYLSKQTTYREGPELKKQKEENALFQKAVAESVASASTYDAVHSLSTFNELYSSNVCELRFRPHEIERVASYYVERTGELLTAPLKNPRVAKDAVPSKLPGCSTYRFKKQKPDRSRKKAPEEKKGPLSLRVCRTCLAHKDLYLIDNVNREGLDLKEIIENWTPLKLKKNEKLPRKMCQRCINNMYQTYQFLLKCKKSEETLKRYFYQGVQNELNEQVLIAKNSEMEVCENSTYKKNNKTKSDSENVDDIQSDIHYTEDLSDVRENNTYKKNKAKSDSENVGDIYSDIHYTDDLSDVGENNTYKKNNKAKSDSENVGDIYSDIHYTDDLSDVGENNTYKKNNQGKSDSENVGDIHSDIHYTEDLSDVEDSKELINIVFDDPESEKGENTNTLSRITNIKIEFDENEVIDNEIKTTNDEQTVHDDNLTDLVNKELKNDVGDDRHEKDNADVLFDIANDQTEIKQIEVKNKSMKRRRLKAQLIDKKHLSKSKNISYVFLKGPPYICITCDASFQSYKELRKHKTETNHKKLSKFLCPYCNKKHDSYSTHVEHVRTHTGEKPNKCSICGKRFNLQCVLKRHMLTHMEVKPHSCTFCNKQFTRRQYLTDHERKHTGEKLICSFCGKGFSSYGLLRCHEKAHKGPPGSDNKSNKSTDPMARDKLFECHVCGKELQSHPSLKAHLRLLHGPRNFKCEICGRAYVSKKHLEDHIRISHQGIKHFCNVCDKAYTRVNDLKFHMKSHLGPNVYPCELCEKTFTYKNSLVQHRRIHTGDTKYQCKECFHICVNKRNLEQHMRVHTGDKQFVCNFCGKMFAQQTNLYAHMKIHTGEKNYACEICGKTFYRVRVLNKHLATHAKHKEL
ncbi:zinc finger protein 813-like [Sitophilus oryzae]|uniref:Zinc finger protein 813-like n=1 Tax=Sitophilus oryzae TaxID=7048 RepID=A0A6J2YA86_SITOR|nr:zinc finger protein 813-like [Sitophilus oryzae]XP_030760393.1 zinc finger protein 813-like [Sitophilus oryzae]